MQNFISGIITSGRTTADHVLYPFESHMHGPHCPFCKLDGETGRTTKTYINPVPSRSAFCWDKSRLSLSYGAKLIQTIEDTKQLISKERSMCYIAILPRKEFPIQQFYETFVPLMSENDTLLIIPYYHSGHFDMPYRNNILQPNRKPWTKKVILLHLKPKSTSMDQETKTLRDVFITTIKSPITIHECSKRAIDMFKHWEVELLSSVPILLHRFIGYPL